MSRVLFFLILKPLSFLPLRVLYVLSDMLYVVLYRLVGFRKKVVLTNMRNSFPNRSEKDIQQLASRFYRHLADVIIESLRMFSISEAEARSRMRVKNPEVLNQFFNEGKSIFITAGHYNNWEYAAMAMNLQMNHQAAGVYTPLANPFFNKKIQESRGKFGIELIPKKEFSAYMAASHKKPVAIFMGTDQSPTLSRSVYWTTFLNQDTGVMRGTEHYSKRYNMPIVFGRITKIARGYYEMSFSLVEDNPKQSPDGAITEKHTRLLEEEILEAPEFWLWTHKRWKRKRDPQVSA